MATQRRDAQYRVGAQSAFARTALMTTARPVHDARSFERTMQMRREIGSAQSALQKFEAANSRTMAANQSDNRVEALRRMRSLQQQNAEVREIHKEPRCVCQSCLIIL